MSSFEFALPANLHSAEVPRNAETEVPPVPGYEAFSRRLEAELRSKWDSDGGVSPLTRGAITHKWLQAHPEGSLFMPDNYTLVGDPGSRDAIMSAILLDMMTHGVCRLMIDKNGRGGRNPLYWARKMHMSSTKKVQYRLDDYLSRSGYYPSSPNSLVIYNDLLEIFQRARKVAYFDKETLPKRDLVDTEDYLVGMLSEYKLLNALHRTGYPDAFPTDVKQDNRGYDIGIPYLEPRHWASSVKYIQVKTCSALEPLRAGGKDKNGSLVIKVPSHHYGDYFSLNEEDDTQLSRIMDGYLPRALAAPEISNLD